LKKKLLYVCSPYRPIGDDPEKELKYNRFVARSVCETIVLNGDIPYAPHLFFPQFLDDACELQRMEGIVAGLEMLELADELVIVGDRVSPGMALEIKTAKQLGKRIFKMSTDGDDTHKSLSEQFEEMWEESQKTGFDTSSLTSAVWEQTQIPKKIVDSVIRTTAEIIGGKETSKDEVVHQHRKDEKNE